MNTAIPADAGFDAARQNRRTVSMRKPEAPKPEPILDLSSKPAPIVEAPKPTVPRPQPRVFERPYSPAALKPATPEPVVAPEPVVTTPKPAPITPTVKPIAVTAAPSAPKPIITTTISSKPVVSDLKPVYATVKTTQTKQQLPPKFVPKTVPLAEPETIVAPVVELPSFVKPAPIIDSRPRRRPAAKKQTVSGVLLDAAREIASINYKRGQRLVQRISAARPSIDVKKNPFTEYSRTQLALVGMAGTIFIVGIFVSLQAALTNNQAATQIATINKKTDAGQATDDKPTPAPVAPSTTPVPAKTVAQYFVAPDLPRYLHINKLGVHARVLQVGIKANGELGTPTNVFDTGWYTGSAKPGQPGASLIDGHVSSWSSKGVFYGIKNLIAGDTMQIERGDGMILTYKVVRVQTYNADAVDMQAAITPVTPGKQGLNLITCTGQLKPGTHNFSQRVVVFTEQI